MKILQYFKRGEREQKKLEETEKIKLRQEVEKEFQEDLARFIDLPSLFVEPNPPSVLIQWLPSILSGITLVALFLKK